MRERKSPRAKPFRNHGRGKPAAGAREAKTAADKAENKPAPSGTGGPSGYWVFGQHAVAAILGNPRRQVLRLLRLAEAESGQAAETARHHPLPAWERVEREILERLVGRDAVHQGVAAQVAPLPESDIYDLLDHAEGRSEAVILILDQVTDPQNVGAILRSAAAFGALGVILTERHAAPESGALAKAASGALEHVPVARVPNLARAMALLKEGGFWCVGLAAEAKQSLAAAKLSGRIALCLGAEGTGLRRLTRDLCDLMVRLPTQGPIGQLNVANAAAVGLYELARERPER